MDFAFEDDKQLTDEHIEILNRLYELMKSLDIDNLSKLQEIYNNTPEIIVIFLTLSSISQPFITCNIFLI